MSQKSPKQMTKTELVAALTAAQAQPVMFSTRIPSHLKKQIAAAALADGRSVQDVTAEALTEWLSRRDW